MGARLGRTSPLGSLIKKKREPVSICVTLDSGGVHRATLSDTRLLEGTTPSRSLSSQTSSKSLLDEFHLEWDYEQGGLVNQTLTDTTHHPAKLTSLKRALANANLLEEIVDTSCDPDGCQLSILRMARHSCSGAPPDLEAG